MRDSLIIGDDFEVNFKGSGMLILGRISNCDEGDNAYAVVFVV